MENYLNPLLGFGEVDIDDFDIAFIASSFSCQVARLKVKTLKNKNKNKNEINLRIN